MKPEEQLAEEIKNIIKAKIKDEILNDPLGKPYCQIDVDILLEETAKETIRSRDAEWFSEDVKAEAIPKKKGVENMTMCRANLNEGKDTAVFSPCLKNKGHIGEHMHEELCCGGCMCGGFDKRIQANPEDYKKYQNARNQARAWDKEADKIKQKYLPKDDDFE